MSIFRFAFLATTALVALAAGSADAADTRAAVRPPVAPTCPATWWQGWYAGVDFGAVAYTAHRADLDGQLAGIATYTQKQAGYFGGGQIGANWTTCNAVLGIEVDGSGGNAVAKTGLFP